MVEKVKEKIGYAKAQVLKASGWGMHGLQESESKEMSKA